VTGWVIAIVVGGALVAGLVNNTELGWAIVFGVAIGSVCTALLNWLVSAP